MFHMYCESEIRHLHTTLWTCFMMELSIVKRQLCNDCAAYVMLYHLCPCKVTLPTRTSLPCLAIIAKIEIMLIKLFPCLPVLTMYGF